MIKRKVVRQLHTVRIANTTALAALFAQGPLPIIREPNKQPFMAGDRVVAA